jgi:hypothetical protein
MLTFAIPMSAGAAFLPARVPERHRCHTGSDSFKPVQRVYVVPAAAHLPYEKV